MKGLRAIFLCSSMVLCKLLHKLQFREQAIILFYIESKEVIEVSGRVLPFFNVSVKRQQLDKINPLLPQQIESTVTIKSQLQYTYSIFLIGNTLPMAMRKAKIVLQTICR